MNLKSKIFGTLAASVLALSMTSGVMAQTDQVEVEGTVTLAPSFCRFVNVSPMPLSFGTWTWDGEEYENDGNNVSTLSAELQAAEPDGTCDVTLTLGDGLEGPGGTIGPDRFSAQFGGSGWQPLMRVANGYTFDDVSPRSGSGQLRLNSVPDDYETGTYTGTIFIATANAS